VWGRSDGSYPVLDPCAERGYDRRRIEGGAKSYAFEDCYLPVSRQLPFSGHYRLHDFLERGASYPMDTELRWAEWKEDRLVADCSPFRYHLA